MPSFFGSWTSIRDAGIRTLVFTGAVAFLGRDFPLAQTAGGHIVSANEAAQHLLAPMIVTYPKIAQAALVGGKIPILVEVDEAGRVRATKVLVSVPMLDQPARDAVSSATFAPFTVGGRPVPVVVSLVVSFVVGPSLGLGRATIDFDDALNQAAQAMAACERAADQSTAPDAIAPCQRAVGTTTAAGPAALASRVRSLWLLGRALVGSGRPMDAVMQLDAAVKDARRIPSAEGDAPPDLLIDTARAHRDSGETEGALDPFDRARKQLERQVSRLKPDAPDRAAVLVQLRSLLVEYANTLTKAGKTKDADAARRRAAEVR